MELKNGHCRIYIQVRKVPGWPWLLFPLLWSFISVSFITKHFIFLLRKESRHRYSDKQRFAPQKATSVMIRSFILGFCTPQPATSLMLRTSHHAPTVHLWYTWFKGLQLKDHGLLVIKLTQEEWHQWLEGFRDPYPVFTDHRNSCRLLTDSTLVMPGSRFYFYCLIDQDTKTQKCFLLILPHPAWVHCLTNNVETEVI